MQNVGFLVLRALKAGIAGLDFRKLIQIGMDGPNMNLKFHGLFCGRLQEG